MNRSRWQRVEELFQQAVELSPTHREAFLKASCGADEELLSEVLSLLGFDTPAGEPLTAVVAYAADQLDAEQEGHIGPYRIDRVLGHGGMGTVYAAVRETDELQKTVAIKVMKRGFDKGSMSRRFLSERDILSRLDHPYIARLLDAGTTSDGLPYFVMEYVDGQAVTKFCENNSLSMKDRLGLFRKICSAIEYAHRNLVVHRDIKPSNILITAEGTPKLLDFGISKLMMQPGDDAVTTLRLLTPDYASPEQVRGKGITTASDVYSMGILLYELLTGVRPFHFTGMTTSEILSIVLESEPQRPSLAKPPFRLAALEGDLDNIILKAVEKAPSKRYATVEQFSQDIYRHLSGLPVAARPGAMLYRASKFARRHAVGLIAGLAMFISLAVSIVAAMQQYERAERQMNHLENLAGAFLHDFYEVVEPLEGSAKARASMVKTALAYLDSVGPEASRDRSTGWRVAANYERVADIQVSLGQGKEALRSYRQAIGIREQHHDGSTPPDQLRSLLACYKKTARLLRLAGRAEEAAGYEAKGSFQ